MLDNPERASAQQSVPLGPLLSLLAQPLEVPADTLDADSNHESIPKWDSLRQILIAKMLEQHYAIALANDELAELTSVRAIRAVLERHGVAGRAATPPPITESTADRGSLQGLRRMLEAGADLTRIHEVAEQLASSAIRGQFGGTAVRVAVAGSLTTDFLASAIACGVLQEGGYAELYTAPFGAYLQELLDPASALYRFKPDVVVLAPDWRETIVDLPVDATQAEVSQALVGRAERFQQLWSLLEQRTGCRIIQHLLTPPPGAGRGIADRRNPASPRNQIDALNAALLEVAADRVTWIELDRLAEQCGLEHWNSGRWFYNSKLPFDPAFLPPYMALFRAAWRSAHARGKKVLALDLDNTLWGGVIGDDGVDGIALGPASPAGEAFTAWGAYLKNLSQRGVILAACSKNAPEIALEGFNHPHSPLQAADFAAFEVSWQDKAGGLRRIAAALNVGLDSIVFADDNPFECDLVRQNLPEVAVLELGNDPAAFVGLLDAGHWFDLPAYTKEDLQRANSYQGRREAEKDRAAATDIDSYLAGLDMVGRLYRPLPADLPRLAQMEQKTNQFNTATRRYGLADIEGFLHRNEYLVWAFELRDRHADHGLVASMVAHVHDDALHIDNWLMSCRVFSRTAEAFVLNRVRAEAEARGLRRIVGEYLPTAKNGVVADLYHGLGFGPRDQGGRWWELDLAPGQDPAKTFITDADGAGAQTAEILPFDSAGTYLAAADAHGTAHRPEAALQLLRNGIERFPDSITLQIRAAELASTLSDWTSAVVHWSAALVLEPESHAIAVQFAEALCRTGWIAEAEALMADYTPRHPDAYWPGIVYAEIAARRGDLPECQRRFEHVRSRFPAQPDIYHRAVGTLMTSGQPNEAAAWLEAAEQNGLAGAKLDLSRALLADTLEDWPKSLAACKRLVDGGKMDAIILDVASRGRKKLSRAAQRLLVIHGSCQGKLLTGLADLATALDGEFDVVYVASHDPAETDNISAERFRTAALYWEQYDARAAVPMRDKLRASLPADCRRIGFPLVSMMSMWPFDWPEPERNRPEPPRHPLGRFPYGDKIGLEVAAEGLRGEAAFARYMELSERQMPDLQLLFDRDIAQLRKREEATDIKPSDFILHNARTTNLFANWGHLNLPAVLAMIRGLLALSPELHRIRPDLVETMIGSFLPWKDDLQVPIHPTVIRRLGLEFVTPESTYSWHRRQWTFKEYTIRYIENSSDW